MKKLLGSTLALALMFSGMGQANAELLKNFKLGGQIDVQATSAKNVLDFNSSTYDQLGDAQTRVMLHMDWDLLDDVHSKVTLRKNDRTYGTAGGTVQTPAGNSQPVGPAGANILGSVYVDQAYFKIDKLAGSVDATFGRQFYGNSGDLVIYFGPSDKALYGLATTSVDMARFDWSNDRMGVTGIVGKTTGHAVGAAGSAGDVDVRGLMAMCKESGVSAYVYERVTHRSANGGLDIANDDLYVAGLKGKYTMGDAWIKGEFAKNFGAYRPAGGPNGTYTGWAFMVGLGAKADMGMASLSPWGKFAVGSGGAAVNRVFTPISSDFRPGSIYGRFGTGVQTLGSGSGLGTVSSNSLGDRAIWGVGLKATPSDSKLTAGVSLWDYRYQSKAPGATGTPAAATGNKHIGSEIDIDLEWKHSDNVSLGAGVGKFLAGGALANSQGPVNAAKLAYTDLRVKF